MSFFKEQELATKEDDVYLTKCGNNYYALIVKGHYVAQVFLPDTDPEEDELYKEESVSISIEENDTRPYEIIQYNILDEPRYKNSNKKSIFIKLYNKKLMNAKFVARRL
jgi:hypothetical protein